MPVLRRFPSQFDVEVTEYLIWRGIEVDLDTRRLLRKTLELSGELRTVGGLKRGIGIGPFQKYIPRPVVLTGRNPVFAVPLT